MTNKRKTIIIQCAAAGLACLAVFIVILYARGVFDFTFITRPETAEQTEAPAGTTPGTGEAVDIIVPETESVSGEIVFPKYDEALAALPSAEAAATEGRTLYRGIYTSAGSQLARVTAAPLFSDAYSLRSAPARVVNSAQNAKGAYVYTESTSEQPRPVLRVYFGYILWDDGSSVKLCDGSGNVLLGDISSYEPVGRCDLAGNPLFTKDGCYYYYYDGKAPAPGTVVADRITAADLASYPAELPGAYNYIDPASEITPTLPEKAGMVTCTVDLGYFNDITANSHYENNSAVSGIYRFYEHRITRTVTNQAEIDRVNELIAQQQAAISGGTVKGNQSVDTTPITPVEPVYSETDDGVFWGYMDADANVLLEPQYSVAYDFSPDGLAVIGDPTATTQNRLCVINTSGSVIFNAYRSLLYIVERANAPVRDGHYLPDTYGAENIGMLSYDHSLLRVRRRLLDTANRSQVASEASVLVTRTGKLFNIPYGYTLEGYSDGMLLLSKNGLYGYMNYTGRWIVQPGYSYAEPFSEGLAVVGYADGARCMIDTSGTVVLPMVYNYVSSCSNGVVVAFSQEHGWTVYNKMSAEQYAPAVNPILTVKARKLAQAAADAELAAALIQ